MNIRAEMNVVDKDGLVSIGDVFMDEQFVIHQVKLVLREKEGEQRAVVVFPSRKKRDDTWEKLVVIRDDGVKKQIAEAVMKSTDRALRKDLGEYDLKIKITPYENGDTRGYATVLFNGAIEINHIRIYERNGELKVSYPYERNGDFFQTLAGPASQYMRNIVNADIIAAYKEQTREVPPVIPEGIEKQLPFR